MLRLTTETGSTYDFEQDFWRKNEGRWQKCWRLRVLPDVPNSELSNVMDDAIDVSPRGVKVGQRIRVASREEWRISTAIVRIEELPNVLRR